MGDETVAGSAGSEHGSPSGQRAPVIAFVHPAGIGSLGNAAIVDSFIAGVRARIPGVRIFGFTNHPANTLKTHDVDAAFGISSFSMPLYPVVLDPAPDPAHDQMGLPPAGVERGGARSRLRGLVGQLRLVLRKHRPAGSFLDILIAGPRLRREPQALRELRETLAGASTIAIAGSGQLNAEFGGFFAQPYVLWRFARTARAIGADYAVLSVGTGKLGWPSRRLVVRALRSAHYRSYRDPRSRELLQASGLTADDPIVPDLAYALPLAVPALPKTPDVCVGVSPMNYRHPDFHARGSYEAYEELIGALERICVHAIESGHRVVIFISDLSDAPARDDLVARLQELPGDAFTKVSVSSAQTVDALWETFAKLDVAVTVRLHAALLAHVAHRPALTIEHDRKVSTMMAEMGHERFSFKPTNINERELIERLDELIRERQSLSEEIAATAQQYRRRVEEQYDLVFGKRPA